MKKDGYYSLDNIKMHKALYNMIVGERSNGKTFSVLEEILHNKLNNGKQGAIVRRWDTDIKGRKARQTWESIVSEGKLKGTGWDGIDFRLGAWYLFRWFDDEMTEKSYDAEPLAFPFALTNMEHDKSTSYPNITTIFFDEFTSRKGYLPDEFVLFCNVCSTIIRQRDDVVIYMCGNTVDKQCIYFREMGLKHIDKMEQGEIQLYQYGENGECTLAIEYCAPLPKKIKKSDKYFAFDNPKLKMIKHGIWETAIYPRLPIKYIPKEVVMSLYIVVDSAETFTIKGDIVCHDGNFFLYLYEKSYEKLDEDNDIIFSTRSDYRQNWRRNILKPIGRLGNNIAKLFAYDRVYYSTSDVGEIVRSYLQVCKQDGIIKA